MKITNVMLVAMFLMTLTGSLIAFPVTLTNPGFEDDDVPADSYLSVTTVPSGWTAWGGGAYYPSNGAAFASQGISGAGSGNQYLLIHDNSGHAGIKQEIASLDWADLRAGETLTLRMWVTYRSDISPGDVYMWLNDSDGSGLHTPFDITDGGETAAGVWTERTWKYTVTQENIDAGWGPVEIQVGHFGGPQVAYDDISLEYSAAEVVPVTPKEFEGGNRVETDTTLSWKEIPSGSLTNLIFDVYMDTDESSVESLDSAALVSSKQSTYSYDPVLDPNTLYYWRVVTYLDAADTEPNQMTDVLSFRTVYEEEYWSGASWTDDSDSGISVGKLYTHKVNFNASEAASTLVNGVSFENDSDRSGSNWTLDGAVGAAGRGHNVLGDGGALVTNMYYESDAVLTLTGLTPGQDYIFTKYTRGWGETGGRLVHFITSADGRTTTLDGNLEGDGNGHLFMYAYTAPASGELVITFEPVNPDTWHHYAFSNELAVPVYLDPTPLPGASVNYDVELSWMPNGAVVNPTYNLKVSENPDLSNPDVDLSGLTDMSHTPFLNNDVQYYWQVEVVEDGSTVVYASPIWDFVTTPPQDAVKVIEWKFDETSGLLAEQTGPTEDADGILVGFDDANTPGVSRVAGLVNNGLYLNGKDEYVDVSDAQAYMPTADGQSFAISGYLRTFDDFGPLFSMRNADNDNPIINISLGADGVQIQPGKICLLVRDDAGSMSNVNSGITVNDGRWHNFTVTRVGGKWTLYVDGVSRATINGAATGNVNLDLMGIGTSLRWIMDDWQPENSHLRDFHGILDEYTVWDGELRPHQIAELASILPPQGDLDTDLDTDTDDFAEMAANWLADTTTPVQSALLLEDMETYTSDPNTYKDYWAYVPENDYGTIDLSVIADPNGGPNGQVMRLDYDFNGEENCHVPFNLLERRMNLSIFDRLTISVKKLAGSEVSELILDFYDGRDNADPLVEGMYSRGRLTFGLTDAAENEWVTLEADIPDNAQFGSCTDLYRIMVLLEDGGADVGTLLIDSIELFDDTEDCIPAVGEMAADINGDCVVDMLDFVEIAAGWLNGT